MATHRKGQLVDTSIVDIDCDISQSLQTQIDVINRKVQRAIDRLYDEMFVVGTGVCMCGSPMTEHSGNSDDHYAVEQYRDKAWSPAESIY